MNAQPKQYKQKPQQEEYSNQVRHSFHLDKQKGKSFSERPFPPRTALIGHTRAGQVRDGGGGVLCVLLPQGESRDAN